MSNQLAYNFSGKENLSIKSLSFFKVMRVVFGDHHRAKMNVHIQYAKTGKGVKKRKHSIPQKGSTYTLCAHTRVPP